MSLIPPQQQLIWRWPAVINFALGGTGAGFYLWMLLLPAGLVELAGPLLVALGLLSLVTEAGRPLRGRYLLRHLRRSWMSREVLAAALFISAGVAGGLLDRPALRLLATAAAALLPLCQGRILQGARGVTAWNRPQIPLLFITGALAAGFGLLLLVKAFGLFEISASHMPETSASTLAAGPRLLWSGAVVLLLDLALWLAYLHGPGAEFQAATEALRAPRNLVLVVWGGHLLPLLLLLLTPLLPSEAAVTTAAAGTALLLGHLCQKRALILEAGYLRGLAFQTSQEGSEWT